MVDLFSLFIAILALLCGVYFFIRETPKQETAIDQKRIQRTLDPKTQRFKDLHNLSDADTITVALDAFTLFNTKPNAEGEFETLISLLRELSQICKVVVICPAKSEAEENGVLGQLSSLIPSVIPRHRCLFYEVVVGKISQIRQLNPAVHIDVDLECCNTVAPHINRIYCLQANTQSAILPLPRVCVVHSTDGILATNDA